MDRIHTYQSVDKTRTEKGDNKVVRVDPLCITGYDVFARVVGVGIASKRHDMRDECLQSSL